jgi:NAD(P)-dependent dehydrogenase (short-subunit alcohol dehydrogenase family)
VTARDLEGRTAVIVGGSRGIGLGIARRLASEGANIVLTARNQGPLEAAVQLIEENGGRAIAISGSATDDDHPSQVMDAALQRFGSIDMLVNNAASNPQYGPLQEADIAAVDKVWSIVLRAPLCFSQAAWGAWMKEHGGSILNVASLGGLQVSHLIGAYNVGKAGLLALTRQLALEMSPQVRVNAIAPALVRTEFSEVLVGDDDPAQRYPLGRFGEISDCAEAALYLLSDRSGWVTGDTLVLDGGLRLQSNVGPRRPSA